MASIHIVYGVVQAFGQGPAVLRSGFGSETVDSGATSAAIPGNMDAVSIKALDGAMYIAVAAASPDASDDPRIHLATGERVDLVGMAGMLIAALNA